MLKIVSGLIRSTQIKCVTRSLARNLTQENPHRDLQFVYEKGSIADINRLVEFYNSTYLREDQVVVASGVSDMKELQEFINMSLKNQQSMLLVNRADDRIVAAISGGPVNDTTDKHIRFYADNMMHDPTGKRLVYLWADMTSDSDLKDHFQLSEAWDVSFAATESGLRNMGLARFLLEQQRRLAFNNGYKVLCVQCTSDAMAKVCERAEYKLLLKRSLESYKDPFGIPWVSKDHLIQVYYTHLRKKKKMSDMDNPTL